MKELDPTKPYCRRDGKPAKIIYTFKNGKHFVVLEDTDSWMVVYPDGRYIGINHPEQDLINVPEKHEVEVYFCKDHSGSIYASSINSHLMKVLAKKTIIFEEGEGL